MKRILLFAALLATPLVQAQWGRDEPQFDDAVTQLEDELDRLRADDIVVEFASDELTQAETYIQDLADAPPDRIEPEDIDEAERLLEHAERVALRRSSGEPRGDSVIVVDDEEAREDAREARNEAERAHAAADEERERALAAEIEAEHERNENARLRAELGQAQTRVTERGVVLTLGDVLFAVGKSDLKPGAARTLDKLVAAMRRDPDMAVTIEGHTDSTGKRAYNVELSKRRANAVRSYLTSKRVAAQRIKASGRGPDFPVATNATAAGRQQNRRVEVIVASDGFGR